MAHHPRPRGKLGLQEGSEPLHRARPEEHGDDLGGPEVDFEDVTPHEADPVPGPAEPESPAEDQYPKRLDLHADHPGTVTTGGCEDDGPVPAPRS